MVRDIFDVIHGKLPACWEPAFSTNHHKGMPGSDAHITYPGTYHYLAGSIRESARTGIPLLNDIPGVPIPGIDGIIPVDDAKALATIIAIECTKLVLPHLPIQLPFPGRIRKLGRFMELDSLDAFVLYNACDLLPTYLKVLGMQLDGNLGRNAGISPWTVFNDMRVSYVIDPRPVEADAPQTQKQLFGRVRGALRHPGRRRRLGGRSLDGAERSGHKNCRTAEPQP